MHWLEHCSSSTGLPHSSPTTPALAAAMASWFGMPWRATAEEQNTIEPPPLVIMRFTDERRMLKQELRLSLMTCEQAGSSGNYWVS